LLDEEDLFCANCGTEAPSSGQPEVAQRAFDSKYNFECQGCGASMSYDASAQTLRCPFCGSEKLAEQKDAKTLQAEFVVPFTLSEKDALARTSASAGQQLLAARAIYRALPRSPRSRRSLCRFGFLPRKCLPMDADTNQTRARDGSCTPAVWR